MLPLQRAKKACYPTLYPFPLLHTTPNLKLDTNAHTKYKCTHTHTHIGLHTGAHKAAAKQYKVRKCAKWVFHANGISGHLHTHTQIQTHTCTQHTNKAQSHIRTILCMQSLVYPLWINNSQMLVYARCTKKTQQNKTNKQKYGNFSFVA